MSENLFILRLVEVTIPVILLYISLDSLLTMPIIDLLTSSNTPWPLLEVKYEGAFIQKEKSSILD